MSRIVLRIARATGRVSWVMVLAGVLVLAGDIATWGHGANDLPLDKYQSGQLTGKSERSIRIDGRDYALHPKVVIEDDEGRPKQLHDFKPDAYVRFLLKNDRVRELILVTPK